ncbi:MAG: UDP-N-acetylmuramyl-tripeptide synthetase [Candidatus Parcubacteria bacterium]|nr:MAG: UDP-N-acetylmuramyl-tripeptide synthetase [Candidatus Parcubacteria bacterium]
MKKIKKFLRKITPSFLINFYHYLWSLIFALFYRFPSKKIIVIGVTGTKGKSTTCYLIYFLLQKLGFKTALSSSDYFYLGEEAVENKSRLTMPGRGFLQSFLNRAVKNGCEIAVLEVTSEGLMQNRHSFIDFDIAVFLNLHPEHIEHHGSYENYRSAKLKLFKALEKSKAQKKLRGNRIKKTIIVNSDDFEADYFLNFRAEKKITFSIESTVQDYNLHLKPSVFKTSQKGINFTLEGKKFSSSLLGIFNLYNILASFAVIKALDLPINNLDLYLKDFRGLPGRTEVINAKGFKVIIDYAHTPNSIEESFRETLNLFKPKRLLCLVGAAGGIRDKWKRPVIGELAAKYCHHVVISNEDPFDEDPLEIIKAIEIGAKKYLAEFEIDKPVEIIPDRKEAIFRLIQIAEKGDVLITIGKGNESSIVMGETKVPWNEKEVVLEALKTYSKISTKTSR